MADTWQEWSAHYYKIFDVSSLIIYTRTAHHSFTMAHLQVLRSLPIFFCLSRDAGGARQVGAAAVHHGEDEQVAGLLRGAGQAAGLAGRLPAQAPGCHTPGAPE